MDLKKVLKSKIVGLFILYALMKNSTQWPLFFDKESLTFLLFRRILLRHESWKVAASRKKKDHEARYRSFLPSSPAPPRPREVVGPSFANSSFLTGLVHYTRENLAACFLLPPDAQRIINGDVSRDTLANNHPEILFRANNTTVEFRFRACRAMLVPFDTENASFPRLRLNRPNAGRQKFLSITESWVESE